MRTYEDFINERLKDPEFRKVYEANLPRKEAKIREVREAMEREKELEYLKAKAKESLDENINKDELDRALKLVGTYARKNKIRITFSRMKSN